MSGRGPVREVWLPDEVTADWGGRATCPADEFDSSALREEMCWHALEEALTEQAGAAALPTRRDVLRAVLLMRPWAHMDRVPSHYHVGSDALVASFQASTDGHLGADASGLVDLTCTLTAA